MAAARARGIGLFLAACAVISTACTGKDPFAPGTPLGTFHVEAALASSSCGTAPNPWAFDVRLAHEGATLFWIQGGAPIEGKLDGVTKKASLLSRTESTVRAEDARAKIAACVLGREDVLEVELVDATGATLATAPGATAFRGTLTYRFSPVTGADCSDQLAAAGGGYEALPCAVSYTVSAVRTKAPVTTSPASGTDAGATL